jgi:hypothetical protein
MAKPQRFLDWSSLTLHQRRAISSTAIARATRLEGRLHAFVELGVPQDIAPKAGSLAFLPYAAKDLFFQRDRDLIAFASRIQRTSDWHARVPDAIHDLIEIDEGFVQVIQA